MWMGIYLPIYLRINADRWGVLGVRQEPYRGQGLAKAVAIKVLTEHSFGDDGWGE